MNAAFPAAIGLDMGWGLGTALAAWGPEAMDVVPVKNATHKSKATLLPFASDRLICQTWNAPRFHTISAPLL